MPSRLPRDVRRRLRRGRRGAPTHPETGADRQLVATALDVRLGYLMGAPDLTAADVGAAVLSTLPPGPDSRARTSRTIAGFMSEHRMRTSTLAPGRVGRRADEERLAADCVVLAHLAAVAGEDSGPNLAAAEPARAGLDDDRLAALVDERVVRDVVRLAAAAERSLWRPLATADIGRGSQQGIWVVGGRTVLVDLGGRDTARSLSTVLPEQDDARDEPVTVWVARHERLVEVAAGTRGAGDRRGADVRG